MKQNDSQDGMTTVNSMKTSTNCDKKQIDIIDRVVKTKKTVDSRCQFFASFLRCGALINWSLFCEILKIF